MMNVGYFVGIMLSALILFLLALFFRDSANTEIYTLSLHDALPISRYRARKALQLQRDGHDQHVQRQLDGLDPDRAADRSEEHTSELQSHSDLVCRLLLEKKKRNPLLLDGSDIVFRLVPFWLALTNC